MASQSDFLSELQNVAVVVANGELAHPIIEILKRIDDHGFVFDLPPEFVNVIGIKVERTSELNLVEGSCAMGSESISSTESLRSSAHSSHTIDAFEVV